LAPRSWPRSPPRRRAAAAVARGKREAVSKCPQAIQIRLLASEPLIAEPSGICWDDKGRCFVCELHGYNVEGQHDIDELNKSGQLDLEVRRIQASEEAKKKAEAETYGTVKLLRDTDGDGVMDKAIVWADRLPPCYGIAAGEWRHHRRLRTAHRLSQRQRWR
jgi:hypothetical protein